MRITAKEEYGLRCILQLASAPPREPLSAAEIARREGLSCPYVEKLLWTLKKAGFIKSHRGVKGGYVLARPPSRSVSATWKGRSVASGRRRTSAIAIRATVGLVSTTRTAACVRSGRASRNTLWG